jgi:hypothetical protein
VPALARFVRCSMGFTTSYWQKERWSRRAADTLTSYGRCWNPSLGNWDVNWRVGDQDCVRTAMKNLFKPGRSAAWTCAQIRKQLHGKRKLKLPFEPDWHLTDGFRRSGGITLVDLLSPSIKQGSHACQWPKRRLSSNICQSLRPERELSLHHTE